MTRNERIEAAYKSGRTLTQLAEEHKISVPRVHQILVARGISAKDRPRAPRKLDAYVGVYTSREMKHAISVLASKRSFRSLSDFINSLMRAELTRNGESSDQTT